MNIAEVLGIAVPIGAGVIGSAYMLLREIHSANVERDRQAHSRIETLERKQERSELAIAQLRTEMENSKRDIQKVKRAILRIPTDVFIDSDEGPPSSLDFKSTLY